MTACPTLTTERLILRPFEEADLEAYAAMLMTPEVRRSFHLPDTFSRADAWLGMAAWRGQWELRGSGQWALEDRADGQFVGRAAAGPSSPQIVVNVPGLYAHASRVPGCFAFKVRVICACGFSRDSPLAMILEVL